MWCGLLHYCSYSLPVNFALGVPGILEEEHQNVQRKDEEGADSRQQHADIGGEKEGLLFTVALLTKASDNAGCPQLLSNNTSLH